MKNTYKSILLSTLLLSAITFCNAQWIQTNGPLGGYINDFALLDTNIFAATSSGLLRSTIYGSSWSQSGLTGMPVGTIEVAANGSGGMNFYACAGQVGVLLSADSGITWTPANNGLGNFGIMCFTAVPNGSGGSYLYIGMLNAGLYRSDNNGVSWYPTGPPMLMVSDIACHDSLIIAASLFGTYFSNDRGASWSLTGLTGNSPSSVAIVNNPGGNALLFAGIDGFGIFKSSDYGVTWVPFNNGLIDMYPADFLVRDTTIYVSITWQGLLTSSINSSGWTSLNTTNYIQTISLWENGNASMMYMGLSGGTGVYRSPDGTNPVLYVTGMINTYVTSVASIYDGAGTSILFSGYGGHEGRIMRSDDYGANWSSSYAFNNTIVLRSFPHNISGTLLITSEFDLGSYLSADSGASWNQCMFQSIWSLAYTPASSGGYDVFVATEQGVFHSTDGGITWNPENLGITNIDSRAVCISDTTIFAGTAGGVFARPVSGITWTYAGNGITGQDVFSLAAQGTHLFAGTYNDGIFHSVDNGANWTPSPVGVSNLRVNELIFHGTTLFAATNYGVFITGDYGANWNQFNVGFLVADVQDLTVIDSFLVAGTPLGVWIRPLSQVTTGIDSDFSCNTNDCYQLHVYPNPFSSSTSIEFILREPEHINAQIFDQQGRLVKTIVNENLSSGKHNYSWDASDHAQGIYFLRVTSTLQSQTQRLVRIH